MYARLDALEDDSAGLARRITRVEIAAEGHRLQEQHAALAKHVDLLAADLGALNAHVGALGHDSSASIEQLGKGLAQTRGGLGRMLSHLHSTPFMSDPSLLQTIDEDGRPAIGFYAGTDDRVRGYIGFEDIFRGAESMIRDRQRSYVALLRDTRRCSTSDADVESSSTCWPRLGFRAMASTTTRTWSSAVERKATT